MSIDNFIPTWWSANVVAPLRKQAVFTSPFVVNRNWEGEIKAGGDTVKISQIGDVTVDNYAKNSTEITYSALESASQLLKVDQAKYFSFIVDSVDKAQAKGDVGGLGLEQASYKLKDAQDQYVAGLYAQAGLTSNLGTTSSPLLVTAADTASSYTGVLDFFSLVTEALDTANVPEDGRFIVIPPAVMRKLVQKSVVGFTNTSIQQEAAVSGKVRNALGFNILVSNNVANAGTATTPKYKILAGSNAAITFADQIVEIESLKIPGQFGDAIRGLMVYGAKVVQADALACATVTVSAG